MASLSISAFAADVGHTARDLDRAHKAGADSLHIDVMDGHFVQLLGLGTQWLESLRPQISLPIDVHFMTLSPERFIPQFIPFAVASMVFHLEGCGSEEAMGIVQLLRNHGIRGGVAVSPATDLEALYPFLGEIDELLLMCSQPGQPGVAFEPRSMERIKAARKAVDATGACVRISVDGGLDLDLALECLANGADNAIIGRAFFRHEQPEALAAAIHQFPASERGDTILDHRAG